MQKSNKNQLPRNKLRLLNKLLRFNQRLLKLKPKRLRFLLRTKLKLRPKLKLKLPHPKLLNNKTKKLSVKKFLPQ
jgi:hypothetical protein